jgi:tRNA-dihydrouridine synthase C
MRIILAPMEGVMDHTMRNIITSLGGVDRCVSEFIRITDHTLPRKVFLRHCPELLHVGKTDCGIPTYIQLLGDNPAAMANNAAKAARLGAPGIDLNFGCPAKTVNRSGGGAILLQTPDKVYEIIAAVRAAVPAHTPVTAKIRLGYADKTLALRNAEAVAAAGASELIVHGRTKADAYKPPADWEMIHRITDCIDIPVIANGEIWSPMDMQLCQQFSGCKDVMIGRGLLSRPDLARTLKQPEMPELQWPEINQLLIYYFEQVVARCPAKYCGNLLKQWLVYLSLAYDEAELLFNRIKTLKWPDEIFAVLHNMAS